MSETTIPNLYLPPEIMTDDRLTLRHIRVLMAIFSWRKANTNLARVSRQMIADRTGYPLSRISTITTELEGLGWIKKSGNGGKSQWTEYRVRELQNFKKKDKSKGDQNGNGYQNGNGNQNGNETVTDSVTQTVTKTVRGIDTGVITGKEQANTNKKIFASFFERYKGTKRELDTEFDAFIQKHDDWESVLPKLADVHLEYPADMGFMKEFRNYMGERLWESSKKIKTKEWGDTKQGIVDKGKELGLRELDYSQFQHFRIAVINKAKEHEAVA